MVGLVEMVHLNDKGMMGGLATIGEGLARAVHFVLPPRCPGCGLVVEADHRFCATCWAGLRFLGPPNCATCHKPFEHDRGVGAQCAACIAEPPRHAGIRAAVAYGPAARDVVLRLKYGGRAGLAGTVGRLMARLVEDDIDLLVPVPLHRRRLWTRGFNQAALIARALGRSSQLPVDVHLLTRTRATPFMRGLGRRARAKTVAGAFRVDSAQRKAIAGRTIGLVDDVHTSGATSAACTAALRKAGAARVVILCWARVIGDGGDDDDWESDGAPLH